MATDVFRFAAALLTAIAWTAFPVQPCGAQVPTAPAANELPPAYPRHSAGAPEAIVRGKALFGVGCGFCHGSDARGGESGPNLLRSPVVLGDQSGESIAAVVLSGRPDRGMPKFDLPKDQIADIAGFLHSLDVSDSELTPEPSANIVVGDAQAGQAYFNGKGKCNSCHSVAGDLAGIGSKRTAKDLQNALVSGGTLSGISTVRNARDGAKSLPTTVKVSTAAGEVVEGELLRIDDFIVAVKDSSGSRTTFRRVGNSPRVEINNPLQAHVDLLRIYTDADIHDLTAYLVTLK